MAIDYATGRVTTKKPDLDLLDETQRAAVEGIMEDELKNIVIQANAGSGKTLTLTMAIGNYRYEYINDSICAITFTRAAKAEMEGRLHSMGIYDVEVATIHAWAKTRLEGFAKKYNIELKIIQEPEIKKILKEKIVPKYLLTHKAIRAINIDILYTFISGSKNMDVTANYKKTLIALESRYQAYKRQMGLYDFGDYPRYLLEVMKEYDEYIYDIDALFVDEFQDVDPDQFEVFTRVDTKKKFYIGDKKQSIYIFRNADGEIFEKLDNFKNYELQYNYRSYQVIIDLATEFYKNAREVVEENEEESPLLDLIPFSRTPSPVICGRGDGGAVFTIRRNFFGSLLTQKYVGYDVQEMSANESFRYFRSLQPIILCRTNKQVKELRDCGLDCTTIHQAKGLEYDNVILIDFELHSVEDINVREFQHYCLRPAVAMRGIILRQLGILDTQFRGKDMPQFSIKDISNE